MSYVNIKKGSYRNKPVENIIFPLIKNMTSGKKGMFLTVDGSKVFGPDFAKIRVTVKPTGFNFVEDEQDYLKQCESMGMNEGQEEGEFSSQVSDEKRIKEIDERFEILNEMAGSLKNGDIRALIVTGPPGVGKSCGVEKTLDEQFEAFKHLKHNKHEVVLFYLTEPKTEINFEFNNRPHKFIDIENNEELILNPNLLKEKYQNYSKLFLKELKLNCFKYKIDFIKVDINKGFDNLLNSYLLKRQKMF